MKTIIALASLLATLTGCATQQHRARVLVTEFTVTPPASWNTAHWTDQWTPARQLGRDVVGCANIAASKGVSGGMQLVDALTMGPLRDLVEAGREDPAMTQVERDAYRACLEEKGYVLREKAAATTTDSIQ